MARAGDREGSGPTQRLIQPRRMPGPLRSVAATAAFNRGAAAGEPGTATPGQATAGPALHPEHSATWAVHDSCPPAIGGNKKATVSSGLVHFAWWAIQGSNL